MVATVQKYYCQYCGSEFQDYNDAIRCESKGLPIEPRVPNGEMLMFQDEYGGIRWSYSTNKAPISLSFLESRVDRHSWVYIVKDRFKDLGVVITDEGQLFSPTEYKFNPGFDEAKRQELLQKQLLYQV